MHALRRVLMNRHPSEPIEFRLPNCASAASRSLRAPVLPNADKEFLEFGTSSHLKASSVISQKPVHGLLYHAINSSSERQTPKPLLGLGILVSKRFRKWYRYRQSFQRSGDEFGYIHLAEAVRHCVFVQPSFILSSSSGKRLTLSWLYTSYCSGG